MEYWFSEQQARLRHLPETRRYLYAKIDWGIRCLGILGARGTGKTTMMLQYLARYPHGADKALYVSLDHPRFQPLSLYEFGLRFSAYGGRALLLDEVHKYEGWASHVKALYDGCPDLQLIVSGSSLLQIHDQDTDLSRRIVFHCLHGLSFREFLYFERRLDFPVFPLDRLLHDHVAVARRISRQIKPLEHFSNYLRYGYYPYFLEGRDIYAVKVANVINRVLETDLPMARQVDVRQVNKIKKLLAFLAVNVPTQVNIQKLAAGTGISRPKIYEYLDRLHQARLLNLIRTADSGYKMIAKPDKIYLENSNLSYALTDRVNTGTLREMFFASQLHNAFTPHPSGAVSPIHSASEGDFQVNGRFVFEIGGRDKNAKQIRNADNALIAADGIEAGFGNKIPLWLFGFLY